MGETEANAMDAVESADTAAPELSIEDARDRLGDYVIRAKLSGERFVITRHGKPAAALVSIADLRALEGSAA